MRRVDHRRDVVKRPQGTLQYLSDAQVVCVCRRHPKEVRGDWNIEESYTLKDYKSLHIFPVRAQAGAQALFFAAEKQGKVQLFALKKGFQGYELNALYQFKSDHLYKSDRHYLFQMNDFLYFRDRDEVFKVNLKDPKSIEKEILKDVNLNLLQKIAVGGYKDGNFNQLVGSKFDGYLSIFTKKP